MIFAVVFCGMLIVWLKGYCKYADNSCFNWCSDQIDCLWEGITICDCDCYCDCFDSDCVQSPFTSCNRLNLVHLETTNRSTTVAIETQVSHMYNYV